MDRRALSTSPPADVDAVRARSDAADAAEAPHRSMRILLADPDRELRRLVALVLRRDGHYVIEAADGSELLEAIATIVIDGARPFDLIVSAHAIPGISGMSVLSGLRSRGRRTPFVLMTGNPVVQAQATRLGAIVLDRPFDAAAIRRAVERAEARPTEGNA
jgi:CheY-like chemotaxis protein